jgi:hypothetical protein
MRENEKQLYVRNDLEADRKKMGKRHEAVFQRIVCKIEG